MTRTVAVRLILALAFAMSAALPCSAQSAAAISAVDDESFKAETRTVDGDYHLNLGEFAEARPLFEEAIVIRRRLAAKDPGSAQLQMDVVQVLTKIGFIQHKQEKFAESILTYEDQLAIVRSFASAEPGAEPWDSLLILTLQQLGHAHLQLGQFREALVVTQEALDASRPRAAAKPDSPDEQTELVMCLTNLVDAQMGLNDVPAARLTYDEILSILRPLAARDPNSPQQSRDLMITLARMNELTGEASYAQEALDVALGMRRRGILAGSDLPIIEHMRRIVNK